MIDDLRNVEITVFDYSASSDHIARELKRPERQGLFGVLSVGFMASALLTVLGFLLYALFSFRRRFIELGTLRAIGLSTTQLTIFLICELAFLILLGLGAGTAIGVFISQVFIPYLQIGTGPTANVPPYQVEIAWFAINRLYVLFGVLFLVAFCRAHRPADAYEGLPGDQAWRDCLKEFRLSEPFILCDGLVKIYKIAGLEQVALRELNITIEKGELMSIIGASGSGKTTLMNILGGLDRPSAGRVRVDGHDLLRMTDNQLNKYRREKVGFVWQQSTRNLISYLNAVENVMLPMTVAGLAHNQPPPRRRAARPGRAGSAQASPALRAVRRRAAACRHRRGPGQPPAPAAGRRADRRSGHRHRADDLRHLPPPHARDGHHHHHRQPRPRHLPSRSTASSPSATACWPARPCASCAQTATVKGGDHQGEAGHNGAVGGSALHDTFEELVVLDRAGRVHVPQEYLEQYQIKGRARLELVDGGILIRAVDQRPAAEASAAEDGRGRRGSCSCRGRRGRHGPAGRQARLVWQIWQAKQETMNQIADQATGFANSASGSTDYAIETIDLQRVYRRGAEAVYALRGVDLAITAGSFIALKGRSGSGKTTLLNCISGLDQPTSGIARIFGQEIGSWSEARRTTWRRQQVGFIFQSLGLLPVMSAYENVELALRLINAPAKVRHKATTETIDLVGLTKWSDHRPYELSGGQQQRVAIARALVSQPPLVIADEPTANLDTKTAREVLNLFRTIVRERNTTLLMATHDTLAEEYVDHIIYLSDGSVVDASNSRGLRHLKPVERSRSASTSPSET